MKGNKIKSKVPPYHEMFIPTLEALKLLGGSGSIAEINEKVYKVADFDD